MSFDWKPFSRRQLEFIHGSTAAINVADGAVRSGKTLASIIRWLDYVRSGPPGTLLMVGKTERTLKRNVLDEIERIVGSRNFRHTIGAGEVRLFGRTIHVVGANDEKAEGKIRGGTFAGAYCDEASLYPESFWKQLLARCSVEGAKVFATTNPDSPYHWLHTEFLDNQELISQGRLKRFRFTLDDNLALSADYEANLKAFYTGLWYKRMILGLWVVAEGAIYDMWDDRLHVVRDLPEKFDQYYVSIDYGTHNPCVFLLWGQAKARSYAIREYYWNSVARARQKTDSEYAKDLREFIGGLSVAAVIIDPSAASFIAELRKGGGLPIRQADNEVLDGIRVTARLLQSGALVFHESCRNTIGEMAAYVWDPKAQKRGEDKPVKEKDHGPTNTRAGTAARTARAAAPGLRPERGEIGHGLHPAP